MCVCMLSRFSHVRFFATLRTVDLQAPLTKAHRFDQEDPLEEGVETQYSILPGEFHGQKSLAGYSP